MFPTLVHGCTLTTFSRYFLAHPWWLDSTKYQWIVRIGGTPGTPYGTLVCAAPRMGIIFLKFSFGSHQHGVTYETISYSLQQCFTKTGPWTNFVPPKSFKSKDVKLWLKVKSNLKWHSAKKICFCKVRDFWNHCLTAQIQNLNLLFSYRTADENEHSQTNLNEAELSILSDQECIQYGTYRDVITKKLLKVNCRKSRFFETGDCLNKLIC